MCGSVCVRASVCLFALSNIVFLIFSCWILYICWILSICMVSKSQLLFYVVNHVALSPVENLTALGSFLPTGRCEL